MYIYNDIPLKHLLRKKINKALLVVPTFYFDKERKRHYQACPPLGIGTIGTLLKSLGLDVKIVDEQGRPNLLKRTIYDFDPDMIAVFCMTSFYQEFARTIRYIRAHIGYDGLLVAGGPHIILEAEKTLKQLPIDVAFLGESEISMENFIHCINDKKGNGIERVDGLFLKDMGCTGIVKESGINKVPVVDYNLYELDRYLSYEVPLEVARGCPYKCIYCSSASLYNKVVYKNMDYVIGNIIKIKRDYNINRFLPIADTFMANNKWAISLMKKLISLNIGVRYTCNGRINLVDKEMLGLLRKSGCYRIDYGIESISQNILDNISKKINISEIESVVSMSKEEGLDVLCYFMISLPGESLNDMKKTITFARRLKDVYGVGVEVQMCRVYPKSPLEKITGFCVEDWEETRFPQLMYPNVPVYMEHPLEDIMSIYHEALKMIRVDYDSFGALLDYWKNKRNLQQFVNKIGYSIKNKIVSHYNE